MFIRSKDAYQSKLVILGIFLQWVGSLTAISFFLVDEKIKFKVFLIGLSTFLIGLLFERLSRSHILFWIKVKNHPDLAYSWFKKNKSWKVVEDKDPLREQELFPKDEWAGPFKLCVPVLNRKIINIYAYRETYQKTIADFLKQVQAAEN